MGQQSGRTGAAIGFSVKSGWASAVLVVGSATSPRVVDSRRIDLSDPAIPESRQPYHDGFGAERDTGPDLSRLLDGVTRFGRRSVTDLIRQFQAGASSVRAAGVVVGSLIDPAGIANAHIRIHALEGQLFRRVVEDAVVRSRLACSTWRDRDLHALAAANLKLSDEAIRTKLTALGRDVGRPWRSEQKAAALAAWLVMAGHLTATPASRGRRPAA
jgi:hypothetical protein